MRVKPNNFLYKEPGIQSTYLVDSTGRRTTSGTQIFFLNVNNNENFLSRLPSN